MTRNAPPNRAPASAEQIPLFSEEAAGAEAEPIVDVAANRFGSWVVYVDESGDHSLATVDPNYPVFVLAFCVFNKAHYAQRVVPSIEAFKFRHFGQDVVVLHETDIRKERGEFRFDSRSHKEAFIDELTNIIDANNFILIACVIDKRRLRERDSNPYHLAMGFCLETLYELMQEKKQGRRVPRQAGGWGTRA
jgi:hypothetical protein